MKIFYILKILSLNIINIIIEEFIFQRYRFVIILIIFFLIKKDYELYFDIKYIMNFIDKKFLLEISSKIVIKKISFLIIIRRLNINTYNINEYIKLYIYLPDKNNITLIK